MSVSETIKKKWRDPEYRAKQEAAREQKAQKQSQAMKEQWSDPEIRAKRVEAIANPAVRAKMSASHSRVLKEQWQDPVFREQQSKRISEFASKRTGEKAPGFKDGLRSGPKRRPEYNAYHMAKQRCENPKNPKYEDYGLRGIEFRFTSFDEFIAHIGWRPSPLHSLERMNNNGHYELGNVRWARDTEQVLNRRKANSHCRECGALLSCPDCTKPEAEPVTFAITPIAA